MARERTIKQRYEDNADVQRWLNRDEILNSEATRLDADDIRPAFDPGFLAEHHERDWILSSLGTFYTRQLIDDLVGVARSGKEATVYMCRATAATGYALLAAKTYRPRMFRSLRNDAIYREGRALRDGRGRAVRSRKEQRFLAGGSERARMGQVGAWIQHEYQTQRTLHAAGVTVPEPLDQAGNAILMEFIGDDSGAAPLLQRCRFTLAEAQRLFELVLADITRMLGQHIIHGDLSAYNILYWQEQAVIIDLAQAVDPRYNSDVYALLERDILQTVRFFERFGVQADPQALAGELWASYMVGGLE